MHSFLEKNIVAVALVLAFWAISAAEVAAERRTPPDLSGVWDFRTVVPLERPEAPAVSAPVSSRSPSVWSDHGSAVPEDQRASLVFDPLDGRLPALLATAREQAPGGPLPADGMVRIRVGGLGTDGPEERGLSERCLQGFNAGPPIVPGHYNQNLRIVQTADYVVLLTEMIHDARVVRMNVDHAESDLRRWSGNSVGWWEGETLVVDTRRFTNKVASFAPSAFTALGTAKDLHLIERLRLRDPDTLEYEFTVDDPGTFVRPFSAVLLMKKADHKLYEYACHEGNKPLLHILQAARNLGL